MSKLVNVIYLNAQKLQYCQVQIGTTSTIVKSVIFNWEDATIPTLLSSLKKTYALTSFRLLLANDLSYLITKTEPFGTEITRSNIADFVTCTIPEKLLPNEWDFRVSHTKSASEALIFAPLQEPYREFVAVAKTLNLSIELVLPEIFSKQTDRNPVIGIALEKLDQKDADQLGIIKPTNAIHLKDNSEKNIPITLLAVGIGVVLLFSSGMTVWLGSNSQSRQNDVSPISQLKQSQNSDLVLSAQDQSIEETLFTHVTLNIVGTQSQIESMNNIKDILWYEGFTQSTISTSSAIAVSKQTTIRRKSTVQDSALNAIIRALNSEFPLATNSAGLTADFEYDLVIVVGISEEE